jgi:hypothetical protein
MSDEKYRLIGKGTARVLRWCKLNSIDPPEIHVEEGKPRVASCAYYRDGHIWIYPSACATLGKGGPAWSWPGYIVDRTPYGVLCHELGHHVDQTKYEGVPRGHYSRYMRLKSGHEPPITSYAPDDAEWFAEMFRLFVTNPQLLKLIRPASYRLMRNRWRVLHAKWQDVLHESPRHLHAAQNKIDSAVVRKLRRTDFILGGR